MSISNSKFVLEIYTVGQLNQLFRLFVRLMCLTQPQLCLLWLLRPRLSFRGSSQPLQASRLKSTTFRFWTKMAYLLRIQLVLALLMQVLLVCSSIRTWLGCMDSRPDILFRRELERVMWMDGALSLKWILGTLGLCKSQCRCRHRLKEKQLPLIESKLIG